MQGTRCDLDIVYHVDDLRDDSTRFIQAAEWVVAEFQLQSLVASVSIVDDPTIHQLNREYLDHDWPTDVVSFVFDESQMRVDGEVIASADTARKMFGAAGWDLADEILLYIVHGLLHLAGMDDTTPTEREAMRLAEKKCLLALGVDAQNHLERWQNVSY